jgi:peptidoglycan glycosyltransferase
VYPQRALAAQTIGYSTIDRSRSGLEQSMNDFLTGSNGNLSTLLDKVADKVTGRTQQGNSLVVTLAVEAQQEAQELLADACGAVVALEPATGRVLVLASSPSYDLNLVAEDFQSILDQQGPCRPAAPLLNRGTAGLYAPGSTFKVITTAAALESGRYTPESAFDDPGYCVEYDKRVFNFADQSGPEVFGRLTLAQALENSVNSVFCEIGKELTAIPILETARRFGFYEKPPLETPSDERLASGLYEGGELYFPDDPNDVDPGRLAFGQERMLVTPIQMAMVAAGIANGGVVMEPQVVRRILKPDGSILSQATPEELGEAVSAQTAAELTAMMELVVQSGTGTAAQIPGVRVAGKTGTAETGRPEADNAWFIGFAPADEPRVAIAVVLSDQTATGGQVAAPIAGALMETLLSGVA